MPIPQSSGNGALPGPAAPDLLQAARAAARNAYAPYSGFHVGAAVLSASGRIYAGANVENVAFPVGTCAEAGALAAARTAEGEALKVAAVLVYAENAAGVQQPCSPCGACRQRLVEFGADYPVTYFGAAGRKITATAASLMPGAFSFDPPAAQ